MSDINCPMCGKRNPAGSEVCQFCQARIKPLVVDASSENISSVDPTLSPHADLPGWLASLRQPDQDGSEPGDLSDSGWLSDLRDESQGEKLAEQGGLETEDLDSSEFSEERQLPEWLKDIMPAEKSTLVSADHLIGDKDQIEEEPEWLLDIREEEGITPSQEVELPDWLGAAEPDTIEAAAYGAELANQELVGNDEQLPSSIEWPPRRDEQDVLDWLDRPRRAVEPTSIGDKKVDDDFSQELPSWLSELDKDEPDQVEQFLPLESTGVAGGHVSDLPYAPSEEYEAKGELESYDSEGLEKVFPIGDELKPLSGEEFNAEFGMELDHIGDLSWLDDLGASVPELKLGSEEGESVEVEPGSPVESAGEPELPEAVPTWSSESGLGKAQLGDESPLESSDEEDQAQLTPAELPSWLKAMRPVAAFDVIDESLEAGESGLISGVGPLAGLKGVLPAEPDVARVTKPSTYSTKLHYSNLQQTHANLLSELIQSEGEVKPLPPAPLLTSQGLLRILISVVLFAVVLFTILTGSPVPQKPNFTPEVFAVSQLILGLPAGQPVLVAIDYSPGYSGEVGAILEAVVNHLVSKGAFITFVSTKPEGPLQAELIVENVNQTNQMPASANLGFVPGGSTGLLAFSIDPQKVIPKDVRAQSVWESPPLQSVKTISDFSAIIVATENTDIARNWIEQTRPFRKETPMILAISAQTEPLIRPYYDASPRQIQGLLVGYSTAVIYETILGHSNQTTTRWPPFASGLSAGVLLIAIGVVVNIILSIVTRSKENKHTREKP